MSHLRAFTSVSFTLMVGYALGVWQGDWWAIIGIPVGVAIVEFWPLAWRRRKASNTGREPTDG